LPHCRGMGGPGIRMSSTMNALDEFCLLLSSLFSLAAPARTYCCAIEAWPFRKPLVAWTKAETKRNHLLLVDGLILRVQRAMQLGMGMVGVAGAVRSLERGGFRV